MFELTEALGRLNPPGVFVFIKLKKRKKYD